ncbi:CRISPR-associated endonuclease Cas1 [Microvirga antarctica]|uniref:CRISPR-associated endonuclease Cas1 n=1 Tax=Microvirga antarctica TaxID=2819233 RepID=UPI001B30F70C|nr:CRISPR-associated endonuclease Cas1 [Microvirga antarctica]
MTARSRQDAPAKSTYLRFAEIANSSIEEIEPDDEVWALRSGMWQDRLEKTSLRRTKRAKAPRALTLAGHGISLRIEGGALTIRNGFTHYPQTRQTYRYFKGDLSLPEQIIVLDGNGSISFDVLAWLSEQKVAFAQINWKGEVVCISGASGYSANSHRVRWQLETREIFERRMQFSCGIITGKIEASIITLEKVVRKSDKWELAMKSAYAALTRLEENPPQSITDLRVLEANCAASYFRSWQGIPIKWRGTSRRPIPDNWAVLGQRSSPYHLAGNRNAGHPVNAMLNYAYSVLETEVRLKAITEGYDPTIGIMHEGTDGSSKFIFDLMEPERPKVDRKVLDFVKSHVFSPADFVLRADGVVRLTPQLARALVSTVVSQR